MIIMETNKIKKDVLNYFWKIIQEHNMQPGDADKIWSEIDKDLRTLFIKKIKLEYWLKSEKKDELLTQVQAAKFLEMSDDAFEMLFWRHYIIDYLEYEPYALNFFKKSVIKKFKQLIIKKQYYTDLQFFKLFNIDINEFYWERCKFKKNYEAEMPYLYDKNKVDKDIDIFTELIKKELDILNEKYGYEFILLERDKLNRQIIYNK